MQLDQAGADADQQANMDEALQRLSMARAQAGSVRNERYAMQQACFSICVWGPEAVSSPFDVYFALVCIRRRY